VLVLDNGPIHTSKLTTKALGQRPWLTIEWLPPRRSRKVTKSALRLVGEVWTINSWVAASSAGTVGYFVREAGFVTG